MRISDWSSDVCSSDLVPEIPRERVLRALGAGLVTALLTRWPVAALGMAAVGWFGAELFGSRRAAAQATARTEAIAAWTEMLRDTMSGAHGLEEAVTTSAIVAPAPIRRAVTALAVRVRSGGRRVGKEGDRTGRYRGSPE